MKPSPCSVGPVPRRSRARFVEGTEVNDHKIWKSSRKGSFRVQRKDGRFVLADRAGRAFRLTESELFDLTDFLDDVCDDIEDNRR